MSADDSPDYWDIVQELALSEEQRALALQLALEVQQQMQRCAYCWQTIVPLTTLSESYACTCMLIDIAPADAILEIRQAV